MMDDFGSCAVTAPVLWFELSGAVLSGTERCGPLSLVQGEKLQLRSYLF